jgi:hypothetical protein
LWPVASLEAMSREGTPMARSPRSLEIDGEGAFWAVAGFAASGLVGVALRPLRESAGLENVAVVYVVVVALAAARTGCKADGDLDLDRRPHLDEEGGSPPATAARSAAPWSCRPRGPWSTWSAATTASAPW